MILRADARRLPLADESVHCVITSPPYWGLSDYGTARREGGDPECEHIDAAYEGGRISNSSKQATSVGSYKLCYRDVCGKCGARRIDNQLGLEPTPGEYVSDMVAVFREVRRVLRPEGTLWLNLGDSYAGSGRGLNGDGTPGKAGVKNRSNRGTQVGTYGPVDAGVKPKDLVGIPWRVAFALQDDGWWLRSDIIWHKPNPMPESVTDRPTRAHEYVFLLAKSPRYYYDNEAVKESSACDKWPGIGPQHGNVRDRGELYEPMASHPTRNRRDVWTVATQPFPGAHFATMPPSLVEPCIMAGTSERGCCPKCGAPWERIIERGLTAHDGDTDTAYQEGSSAHRLAMLRQAARERGEEYTNGARTIGWRPTCRCEAGDPVPCTVLDPFSGAGTVGLVADRLGRNYVGCDISHTYNIMARKRIMNDAPLLAREST